MASQQIRAGTKIAQFVLEFARTQPELGQFRVAEALRHRGIRISPSGVRAIWKRHELETLYKRVSAIARKGSRQRSRLSDVQHARFKRAERRDRLLKMGKDGGNGDDSQTLRYHLMVIAARAFGRHGYRGATLKEIAEAAGILPGSIYHYFRSKEDLLLQVHDEGFKDINDAIDQALVHAKGPRRRLEAACAAHLKLLLSANPLAGFTGGSLFAPNMGKLSKRFVKVRDAYEERYRTLIDALDIPPHIDRTVFRLALLGALNWAQVWYKRGKKSPEEIAHQLVEIFCR